MKKGMSFLLRVILFAVLLVCSLFAVNRVMEPKYTFENTNWPTTSTFEQFYKMKRNTVDVLFFGSSFAVNAFSPQEVYEYSGIRSYNLGSEQQSIFMSCAWLKEALQYQSPKAVVLECRYAFYKESNTPFNMNESFMRKSMDPMRNGKNKYETVRTICEKDKNQDAMSYYFTNLLYHSRWKDAGEEDLFISASEAPMKGYSPLYTTDTGPFEPVHITDPDYFIPADALMTEYLEEMCGICRENDTDLILVTVPATDMHEGMHNTLAEFAEEHGISYYDFGEESLFEEAGWDLEVENPADHMNYHGSTRMSKIMADLLMKEYGIEGVQDAQWEESRGYYDMIRKAGNLSAVTDPDVYFRLLQDDDLVIFVSRDAGAYMPEDVTEALSLSDPQDAWILVREKGGDLFREGESLRLEGETGKLRYLIEQGGDGTSIILNDSVHSRKAEGLHVTVYDPSLNKVIDEVCFVFAPSVQALRD